MGDIFLKLLNMSITAGWFILAVLCIRLIFRKFPKWVNCCLWGAVAIRLIFPFSIESPFSMLPSAEPVKSSTIVEGEVQNHIPSIDSHLAIVEHTINPMLTEAFAYNESESAAPFQIVSYVAGIIWICGIILLIICAMCSIIKLHRLVREAVCVRKSVYICDSVKSPFILGIARPRVYLSSALSEKEMDYMMAHESAHLRRKDHWWKPLGYLLLCIYWFHPLCWAAYAMFCKDMELACDEKAARTMTFHERKEYSKILLSCANQKKLVLVCPLAFGEAGVKERVKSVLKYKKPTLWITAAAVFVCILLAVCFLTNPEKEHPTRTPAESAKSIVASNEEIIPKGNALTIDASQDSTEKDNSKKDNSKKDTSLQTEEAMADKTAKQDSFLYEQPQEDQVNIKIQPSMIREYPYYYYVPEAKDQEWLLARVKSLHLEGKPGEMRWKGHKETGWQIVYHDTEIAGFEGGYLYYTYYDDKKGFMECWIEDPKLCDYIQILLMEKIGYQKYDISKIKDLVSVRLDVKAMQTDWQLYSQTITDQQILQTFEEWFRNAEYIFGGAECGNQCACLELTLANGDIVRLSMATDSCPIFCLEGVAYDYRPVKDWDNSEFFKYFDKIPWEY